MDFDRRFGVEIEHGNPAGWLEVGKKVRRKFPRWDNTGSDGSGVEVRSPILRGQSGLDELGEVMEFLTEIGGYVSQSDGMHVHHDARDFVPRNLNFKPRYTPAVYDNTPAVYDNIMMPYYGRILKPAEMIYPSGPRVDAAAKAVHRVLESYATNQPVINQLVDPHRRGRASIDKQALDNAKRKNIIETGRYNVHFAGAHGTFEFRQFEGCLDPAKAFAWIEFGQHFLNYCKYLGRPATCATTAFALMRRLGVSTRTQHVLIDRPDTTILPTRDAARAAHGG